MAWIELHQTLPRHPKLIRLATKLRIPRAQAAGHLTFLWLWTLDYAPSGDLSAFGPAEISAAADYSGDAELFVAALRETRWLDDGDTIHDWEEYAGKLIEKRAADRDRKRIARQSAVQGTSDGHPPDSAGTARVPYSTVPNQGESHTPGTREQTSGVVNATPAVPAPTQEEAIAFGERSGVTRECTEKWFLDCDARGWTDRAGQPISRWQSSLLSYGKTWRALSAQGRGPSGGTAPQARRAVGPSREPMTTEQALKI
ncbi:MAG: hypothetical protein J0L84_20205 [Verrucomicrobia bacterium]|nr:hypothetical protein [Verrucomicrobiota bacterium]